MLTYKIVPREVTWHYTVEGIMSRYCWEKAGKIWFTPWYRIVIKENYGCCKYNKYICLSLIQCFLFIVAILCLMSSFSCLPFHKNIAGQTLSNKLWKINIKLTINARWQVTHMTYHNFSSLMRFSIQRFAIC